MESIVVEVLRTPELQRLRKIRQLGLAHLVFPAAEHSRFAHSLGAAYLAIRFGRHIAEKARAYFTSVLCPDDATIRDLALAALCHDLGHGPLSHAFEREIVGRHFNREAWARALGFDLPRESIESLQWHELIAQGLLRWPRSQLHQLLEQHEHGLSARIADLLLGKYFITYLPKLLSSDVDVDRADFIRRDTHHTGVAYGRYDLNWMISTCTLGRLSEGGHEEWTVGFEERKALRVVEQFLIARRAMYDTVYHHKTVRCAEGMVALFLRRLRKLFENDYRFEVDVLARSLVEVIQGKVLTPERLLSLDDFALSVLIDAVADSEGADRTVADLARRIRARDLFKMIPVSSDQASEFLRKGDAREQLAEAIKPFVPGEPESYLVQDEVSFRMLSDERAKRAAVVDSNGRAQFLRDHPSLGVFRQGAHVGVRLFTVREAVDTATQCVLRG